MCDPVSATMAATAVVGFIGAQQSADAQADAAQANFNRTQDNANRAFLAEAAAENQRLVEEAASDSAAIQDTQRESQRAQATARVAAGEAGVAGLSIDALLGDFQRDEATFRDRTKQSAQFRTLQSRNRLAGADATRQSRINSAQPQPIEQPSFLGAALRIGATRANVVESRRLADARAATN